MKQEELSHLLLETRAATYELQKTLTRIENLMYGRMEVLEEIAQLAKVMRDRLYNKDSRLRLDDLFEKLEEKS